MVLGTAFFASMHASVRLVSGDMHPFEVSFFRNLFGLIVVTPLIVRGGVKSLRTYQLKTNLLRGLTGIGAMLSWFYALSILPLAQATALSFTATIFGSLGAVLFLRERMRLRRWCAIFCGFFGALIILRPGFSGLDPGALLVLFSSLCWGTSMVLIKRLASTDSTVCIVAWMSIMLSVLSLPPALLVWTWPSFVQLLWLLLIGGLGTLGHLASTEAFKHADATAIFPLDFTRLIWATLIGYFVFSELPDIWTWIGAAVIVGSASYITYRETALKREPEQR